MHDYVRGASSVTRDELLEQICSSRNLIFGAILQLVRIYRNPLQLAEDLTQDVLLKALRSIDSFDRRAKLETWLFAIAKNHFRDYYSYNKKRMRINNAEELVPEACVDPLRVGYADVVTRLDVQCALEAVSPEDTELLLMQKMEGWTCKELATLLGIPIGTVKSRLSVAATLARCHYYGVSPPGHHRYKKRFHRPGSD